MSTVYRKRLNPVLKWVKRPGRRSLHMDRTVPSSTGPTPLISHHESSSLGPGGNSWIYPAAIQNSKIYSLIYARSRVNAHGHISQQNDFTCYQSQYMFSRRFRGVALYAFVSFRKYGVLLENTTRHETWNTVKWGYQRSIIVFIRLVFFFDTHFLCTTGHIIVIPPPKYWFFLDFYGYETTPPKAHILVILSLAAETTIPRSVSGCLWEQKELFFGYIPLAEWMRRKKRGYINSFFV